MIIASNHIEVLELEDDKVKLVVNHIPEFYYDGII